MRVLVHPQGPIPLSIYSRRLAEGWAEKIRVHANDCSNEIVYDVYTFERILPTLESTMLATDAEAYRRINQDVKDSLDDFVQLCKCSK